MDSISIARNNCIYTHCYCEENVWKICERLKGRPDLNEFHVVFISNPNKQIPLWCQKSSTNPSQPVVWDYHVILLHERSITDIQVYDLDSILKFPCSLQEYVTKALKNEQNFTSRAFNRCFRVIPAPYFLKTFASDRSHMLAKNGEWLQPPPSYPPIKTQDSSMNLFEFIDMHAESGHGTVLNMEKLLERFHCHVDWLQT